jgi:hypothetical protein
VKNGDWRIAGKPIGTLPTVGATYKVAHIRKGNFTGKCLSVSGEWMSVKITDGKARAILPENEWSGEEVTVRNAFCTLVEVSS